MKRLGLFLAALAAVAAAGAAVPPGAGFLAAGTEILELRDAVARHYSNGDGTITAVISARPEGGTDAETALPTFEYEYATGHCAYDGSQYGKTDFGLIKVEREVVLQPPSVTERVGWMKFQTSSLPDSVTITGARVHHIVVYFEHSMGLAWTRLEADPVPTGAQALYNAIYNAEVCAMGPMGRVFDTADLGQIGVAHIRNTLGQGWVAFGLVGYNYSNVISKRGWINSWNTQPRSDAPWLLVTYEPPTGVAEPGPAPLPPVLSVAPNPVTGGEARIRVQGKTGTLPPISGPPANGEASQCFPDRIRVCLIDAAGRSVLSRSLVIGDWSQGIPLDVRGLACGVYLVRLEADGRTASARLVIR